MCTECGCSSTAIGGTPTPTGKPQDPYGQYDGVGGSGFDGK